MWYNEFGDPWQYGDGDVYDANMNYAGDGSTSIAAQQPASPSNIAAQPGASQSSPGLFASIGSFLTGAAGVAGQVKGAVNQFSGGGAPVAGAPASPAAAGAVSNQTMIYVGIGFGLVVLYLAFRKP